MLGAALTAGPGRNASNVTGSSDCMADATSEPATCAVSGLLKKMCRKSLAVLLRTDM